MLGNLLADASDRITQSTLELIVKDCRLSLPPSSRRTDHKTPLGQQIEGRSRRERSIQPSWQLYNQSSIAFSKPRTRIAAIWICISFAVLSPHILSRLDHLPKVTPIGSR